MRGVPYFVGFEGSGQKSKSFTYQTYPGTGHGFLRPGREGSDGPQVEKAWRNILDFFKKELDTKSAN